MPGLVSHPNLLLINTQNQKHITPFRGSQISVGSSEVGIRLILNRDIWHLPAERLGHSPGEFTVSLLFHKPFLPVTWPLGIPGYGVLRSEPSLERDRLPRGTRYPRTNSVSAKPAQRRATAPGKAPQRLRWLQGNQDISFPTTCLRVFTGPY